MCSNMTHDIIIGCDIGLSGGIVFFDSVSKSVLSIYNMPTNRVTTSSGREKGILDLERLKFILEIPKVHKESAIVVLENVHAFPGQGVVAIATLLEQKGTIRGLAKGLGYDEHLVEPKTWQKYFDIVPPQDLKGTSAKQTKALRKKWLKSVSLETARDLFPEWKDTKLERNDAHGLSDALLIGRWFLETNIPLDV